ncbi:very long chain fatty acid elongase 4-like [Haliotis cracherodii]|uniref:very long chain fatty acid elongase 4-like n=1 Tax=Haliotis cracherodii TaxID=6455 RepID=UPI0039ED6591
MLVQELLEDMRGWYNDSMGKADPRAFDLPLAQTPMPILSILLLYILVVLHGPRMMEQQKPFNLRWLLVGYNFSMVALSFWIFVRTLQMAIRGRFSLVCQPIDYTDRPDAIEALYVGWLFFFSKIIELIDTVFFILRKKNSQITFLHVYHHTSIVVVTWSGMKWVSGGQSFVYPLLNSLVHVVMYLYYGLSAIGPSMQKYLWWKRYLTMFQLTQFVLMLVHAGVNFFVECDFPKLFDKLLFTYAASIMALFLNFYFRAYIQGKRRAPSVTRTNKNK